jgi:hypothetical protein
LDMKEMILKPRACSLAGSLLLPHHYCRKLSAHSLLPVPSHRGVLVDRLAIGCMG